MYRFSLILTLFIVIFISCSKKKDLKVVERYHIKLFEQYVGEVVIKKGKNIEKIETVLFVKQDNIKKKIKTEIVLTKNGLKYSSPFNKIIKKRVNPKYIYPYIFKKLPYSEKIYHIEMGKFIKYGETGLKFQENTLFAPPFTYVKSDKVIKNRVVPHFIDLKGLKFIKSDKKIAQYLTKLRVKFKKFKNIPSDLRQQCKNGICLINIEPNNRVLKYKRGYLDIKKGDRLKNFVHFYKKQGVKTVYDWFKVVKNYLKYRDISKYLTVDQIIEQKKGDCTEYSKLLTAVLRYNGIAARKVYGIVYKNGKFQYHSWVEYKDGNYWKGCDPTLNLFNLTPHYITLTRERLSGVIDMVFGEKSVEVSW